LFFFFLLLLFVKSNKKGKKREEISNRHYIKGTKNETAGGGLGGFCPLFSLLPTRKIFLKSFSSSKYFYFSSKTLPTLPRQFHFIPSLLFSFSFFLFFLLLLLLKINKKEKERKKCQTAILVKAG